MMQDAKATPRTVPLTGHAGKGTATGQENTVMSPGAEHAGGQSASGSSRQNCWGRRNVSSLGCGGEHMTPHVCQTPQEDILLFGN